MSTIEIGPEYGYVIMIAAATTFHYTLQTFGIAKIRYGEAFTKDYMIKNYSAENDAHKKEFGVPLAKGGHPDNGLGRLSDKLDFITWVKLQNAQRAHLNYLEGLPSTLTTLLLAGLFYPITAAGLGIVHIVGRQLYCTAYRNKGAEARGPGFGMCFLSSIGLTFMSVWGGLKMTGLMDG